MQKHSKCKICGKEQALGGCPEFQSTAPRKGVAVCETGENSLESRSSKSEKLGRERAAPAEAQVKAGTQALPVETTSKPKRGRPKTGFDKLSYNRQFMADKRAATKLGITVKEFRAARNTPSQAK